MDFQKDRASPYADPLNFGAKPSEASTAFVPGDTCAPAVAAVVDDAADDAADGPPFLRLLLAHLSLM